MIDRLSSQSRLAVCVYLPTHKQILYPSQKEAHPSPIVLLFCVLFDVFQPFLFRKWGGFVCIKIQWKESVFTVGKTLNFRFNLRQFCADFRLFFSLNKNVFFEKYNVLFVRFFSDYCGCFFTVFSTIFRVVVFAVFWTFSGCFLPPFFERFLAVLNAYISRFISKNIHRFLSIVMVVFRRRISPGKSLQKSHFVLPKIAFFSKYLVSKIML